MSTEITQKPPATIAGAQLESMGALLADLGIAACLVDRQHRLVWSNRLVGSSCGAELDTDDGGHCFAVHWGLSARCADCLPALVFETAESREGYRVRQRPGQPRKVYRVRAVPVRGARGELSHVLETLVDVTDLARQVSDALVDTRLSSTLAAVGQGVFVVDPKGRIVSWSPGMSSILGYGVDEVLGKHVRLLHGRPRRRAPLTHDDDAGRHEAELCAKDGRLVPVALTTTTIRDERGAVCGRQSIVEDRSEVARLRREIQLGERALAEIVRASGDAIFSTDAQGRVTAWNRGATLILGYEAADAQELGLVDLSTDAGAASELLCRARVDPRPRSLRRALRARGGESVQMDLSVSPIEDAHGDFVGLSIIGRDSRQRERLEQQMVRSEKLAAVGSLAAGLAHEVGTPLNVISAAAEYVLLDLPPDHPCRTELTTVLDETERLRRLISDLLGFARGAPPAEGATDPCAAVQRVLRLLNVQLEKRRVRATLGAPEGLPLVAASADAVHQLLLNVLMNALAAVADGGRVEVTLRPDKLARGDELQTAVCFAVADDGPGIAADLRQRVFDPFFTTRADGTGLGLAVCNRIVEDHGGEIHCGESALGGALIEIVLPAAANARP